MNEVNYSDIRHGVNNNTDYRQSKALIDMFENLLIITRVINLRRN